MKKIKLNPEKNKIKIVACLAHKFIMEYEKLFNGMVNFNNEEKIHITKVLLEIVELRRKSIAEWPNINQIYVRELREKYQERFSEGHRINLLSYMEANAIENKLVGSEKSDFYTKEEFNSIQKLEFKLLTGYELGELLLFIRNHLSDVLDKLLDQPLDSFGDLKKDNGITYDTKIFPCLKGSLILDEMIKNKPHKRYNDYCVFVIKKLIEDGLINDIKIINYKEYLFKKYQVELDKFKSIHSITTPLRTAHYEKVKNSIE